MKRFLTTGIASLLTLGMMAGCAPAAGMSREPGTVKFDFEDSDAGFSPVYADYPADEDAESFYEFKHEYGAVPIDGAGSGIFISGNNHSSDLFMGYVKPLDGFAPETPYHFSVSFKLATDVEGGLVGAGGSPGESVAVKCGITRIRPESLPVESGGMTYYRLNIDAGQQANSGKDMSVVGDMAKTENNRPGEYEFKEFQAEFDVTADDAGQVYLIIGTDSGFESVTSYYLDDITVTWEEAAR